MISLYQERINEIPTLVVVKTESNDAALPLVIYCHGFTSAKEHNLPIAFLLAKQGYRVVLPDSLYHGEREDPNMSESKKQLLFWEIVLTNVKELNDIKTFYEQNQLILHGKIGVAGTSMGGITTAAALTQYDWIKAAAILMGTPKATAYARQLLKQYENVMQDVSQEQIEQSVNALKDYDLSLHIDRLNNRPLLFWHGENDSVVPFELAYTFYEDAKSSYDQPDQLQFIKEKERDHKVSRFAILETEKWFVKHLS